MAKLKVVTGYVPIANHTRSAEEYGKLGEKLREIDAPIQPFYSILGTCWMTHMVAGLPFVPKWSTGDNPQKNTLAYQCATHQKFEWLYQASVQDQEADTFIWIDYGICHVPGVTPQVINTFLKKVRTDDFAIPGCWSLVEKPEVSSDAYPNWRFCGGLMVVPRKYVQPFKNLVQGIVLMNVLQTGNITWDVNHVAYVEAQHKLPIRWYKADHNETMFENYQ